MASVTLSHIVKRYDEHLAVDDVSLEIDDGEFLVLVGPSGCGKTSTLRMIAGLESITNGDIYIGDVRANDVHPSGRDVAMVFQSYALYPHMSVYRNLEYGLRRRGVSRRDARERVNETASFLQMSELLDRRPGQLSGGQRQRVALGRAIVRHPSVFLMDEPLSNLDAKLRVQMRTELLRLHAKLGVTTVYVTHDQVEAMTMGHRIAVMSTGRVQQVGTPLELYNRPANRFVATFLGTPEMNLIDGELRTADGASLFVGPGVASPLPVERIAAMPEAVTMGIRPQHLRGTPELGAGSGTRVPLGSGEIEFVEHLGPESFASVVSNGRSLLVSVDPGREYLAGSILQLDARVEDLHLFDADDGRRLEVQSKIQTAIQRGSP